MSLKSSAREALLSWKGNLPDDIVPQFAQQPRIRRCIHQIFCSDAAALPAEIERNIERIRGSNPGWDYQLHGATDMVEFIEASAR